MPLHPVARLLAAALLAAGAACAGSGAPVAEAGADPAPARRGDPNVLTADQLGRMGSGSLLQALIGRVSAMQVSPGAGCPSVIFRGRKTVLGDPNAAVYVDGTPAVNTCILQQIRVQDVDRVEVYPNGVARSPGYPPHPFGLILVFLRDGSSGA